MWFGNKNSPSNMQTEIKFVVLCGNDDYLYLIPITHIKINLWKVSSVN